MDNLRNIFLLPWLIAAIIAFLTTPLAIKIAKKIGIIDDNSFGVKGTLGIVVSHD